MVESFTRKAMEQAILNAMGTALRIICFALGLGGSILPAVCAAQQILVRTDATSAWGAVSRSDLIVADLEARTSSPSRLMLSDSQDRIVADCFANHSYYWAVNSVDEGLTGSEVFHIPLLERSSTGVKRFESPQRVLAIEAVPSTRAIAVATLAELLVFDDGDLGIPPKRFPLPGPAIDIEFLPGSKSWAALCETTKGATLEMTGSNGLSIPRALQEPQLRLRRVIDAGSHLLVVAEEHDLNRPDGTPLTTVHAIAADGSTPLSIPGRLVDSETAVLKMRSGSICVVTETPGVGQSTATILDISATTRAHAAIALPTAAISFCALEASDGSVVFACGAELVRYSEQGDRLAATQFDSPVRSLEWSGERLLVGEGNRIHLADWVTLEGDQSLELSSGLIAVLHALDPPMPMLGDADGDNVLDTVDASPNESIPELRVPRTIAVRGDWAAGQSRSLPIKLSVPQPGYRFRVADLPEGIGVDPLEGDLPGLVNISILPGAWRKGEPPTVKSLAFELHSETGTVPVSAATTMIKIDAPPVVHGRVLLIPDEDSSAWQVAIGVLQSPPQFYALTIDPKPSPEIVRDYQVVVVSLEAALSGRVPRVSLEQFAASGGGLMIVASASTVARLEEVRDWLSAFRMDARSAAETLRTVREDCDWCEAWASAGLGAGFLASVEPPGEALFMPGRAAREGPMTRAPLGLGRVVFAGSEGLLSAVDSSPEIRNAVLDAVRWLARTRSEVRDTDGDGLADEVEHGGGTDASAADTDGDQLIDGHEDFNGNGRVDEGETDPRRGDTDGDQIPDGADAESVGTRRL